MTIADLAPSLRPLVLLLSSDKPGEVAAAAAQIGRRLRKAGLDWHDLADALEGGGTVTELHRPPAGAATSWADVADFLAEHADDLSRRDREFIASMRGLIARGFHPTPKQAAWLRGLFQRAGGSFAEKEAA